MTEETPAGEPLPRQPFNHEGFQEYLAEHRLMGSRCRTCGSIALPPRALCASCYGDEMEWSELTGEGELTGYTAIHVGLPFMVSEGYSRQKPYCSAVVRLAEGPSITGQLIGADCEDGQEVYIGMPVRVAFIERGEPDNKRVYVAFEKK